MTCSVSIDFVTHHGYVECERNYIGIKVYNIGIKVYNIYMLYTLIPARCYVAGVTSKSLRLIFLQ